MLGAVDYWLHFFTYLQFKDDTMTFYFLSFLSPLQILLDFLFQKAIEHHDCHHVFFWSSTEVVLFYFPNRPATRRSFVLAQAKAGSTCDLTGFEKSFDVDLSCKWLKHLETEGCFRKRLDQEAQWEKGGLQLGIGSSHVLSKFILEIDTDPKDIERY